jgi:hypothetical protein
MLLDHRVFTSQSRDKLEVTGAFNLPEMSPGFPSAKYPMFEMSGDVRLFLTLQTKRRSQVQHNTALPAGGFMFFVPSLKRLALTLWVRGYATG